MTVYRPHLTELKENPNLEWGRVELLRWQNDGKLTNGSVNYPLAFSRAAEAVRAGKVDTFNVASMLEVAAELMQKKKKGEK